MPYDLENITTDIHNQEKILNAAVCNLDSVIHKIKIECGQISTELAKASEDMYLNEFPQSNEMDENIQMRNKYDEFRKKYKDLKNIKNKIENVLFAAQHHTLGNWTYNCLNEKDVEIIKTQSVIDQINNHVKNKNHQKLKNVLLEVIEVSVALKIPTLKLLITDALKAAPEIQISLALNISRFLMELTLKLKIFLNDFKN